MGENHPLTLSFFAYASQRPLNLKWTRKYDALAYLEQVERVNIRHEEPSIPSLTKWWTSEQANKRTSDGWLHVCGCVEIMATTLAFHGVFICLPPSIRLQAMDQSDNREWAWCKRWMIAFVCIMNMVVYLCVNEKERESVFVCVMPVSIGEKWVGGERERESRTLVQLSPWFVWQINHNGLKWNIYPLAIRFYLSMDRLDAWTKVKERERDEGKNEDRMMRVSTKHFGKFDHLWKDKTKKNE